MMLSKNPFHIAYADCFSGISGDMFIGALIDAGLPIDHLREELGKIAMTGYQLHAEITKKQCGIRGISFTVQAAKTHSHRTWRAIDQMIRQSGLGESVQKRALSIFSVLAQAEAKVHGCQPEEVHFHEVGAVDSIIDIVGAAIGLEYFQVDQLFSSPLPVSCGWVECEHGTLPLPAPAVCELLQGVPVQGCDLQKELITPTGAAILKGLKADFGPFPSMTIKNTGYGAGSHIREDNKPNLLRLVLGEMEASSAHQRVEIIEANLDDWSPESFPYLCEKLINLGALDVTLTQVLMKKGRPGFCIQIISAPEMAMELKETLLSETTSIGLRYRTEKRMALPRQTGTVPTKWGDLQVKMVKAPTGACLYPEYESCKKIAQKQGVPIKEVYRLAAAASIDQFTPFTDQETQRRQPAKTAI